MSEPPVHPTRRRSSVIAGLLVTLLALSGIGVARGLPQKKADASHPSAEELAELRRELRELRARVRNAPPTAPAALRLAAAPVERDPSSEPDASGTGRDSFDAPPEAPEVRAARLERESRQSSAEFFDFLGASLESEDRDRGWSVKAESAIRAALLDPALEGSTVERVDCRTTLCRFEVAHPDPATQESFDRWFPMIPIGLGYLALLKREGVNSELSTLVFYSRAGVDFP